MASEPAPFSYRGIIPILPTPFRSDETLDPDSLSRLVTFLGTLGVDGVTVLGVLGEANALSDAEARETLATAVAAADGLPVIAGVSRYGVRMTREFIETAAGARAAAVMLAPPRIDGMSEQALFGYFQQVCGGSPLPVVVQDHPASTGIHMSAGLLVRLIEEVPEVTGLKCESVPTARKLREVKARTDRCPVMTGLGALYGAFDLAAGSDGFNTGFAFPEVLLALRERQLRGDGPGLRALFARFLPLIVFEQQPGPAIRKEIYRLRAVLADARVRAPGAQADPWAVEQLGDLLRDAFGEQDLTAAVTV